ncbi:hypothetical protein R6Q57_016239 [Mikania cordata]
MVNLTLCVLSRPEVNRLPSIFKTPSLKYDKEGPSVCRLEGDLWLQQHEFLTLTFSSSNSSLLRIFRIKFDDDRAGIQQKTSFWLDGVLGPNCPLPLEWNWTYNFQVKDQIRSYFYFPLLNFQWTSGGFGGFIIDPRSVIPIPFDTLAGDITILIAFDKYYYNVRYSSYDVKISKTYYITLFDLGNDVICDVAWRFVIVVIFRYEPYLKQFYTKVATMVKI